LSDSADKLGDSYDTAKVKFLKLEQRLLKQPQLKKDCADFLEEYVQFGHMTPLGAAEVRRNCPNFYMPHHGVLKETSSTTKLRVVFNGSEKSSNGVSLSDILILVQRFKMTYLI